MIALDILVLSITYATFILRMKKYLPLFLTLACLYTQAQDCIPLDLINSDYAENANAIICDEQTTLKFSEKGVLSISKRKEVIVLNAEGRQHAFAVIFYDKSQKVKSASVRFYNQLGEETAKVSRKQFIDQSAINNFSLYEDNRVLYYDKGPGDYPYKVIYEYEYESENTLYLPSWNPIQSNNLSVINSEFELVFPPSMTFNKSEQNFDIYDVVSDNQMGHISYALRSVKAIEKERYSKPLSSIAPSLKIAPKDFVHEGVSGTFNTWKDVGRWIDRELLQGQDQLPDEAINDIQQLVDGVTDEYEKTRLVYEYMQQKCRYISVQIGIGGWKPMKASEVHNRSYGDCKALVNYTKALLNVAGVPSYYTIVYAGKASKNFDRSFTSLQGNHVILQVPLANDTLWLECTSSKSSIGYISGFTDDRDVFVVYPDGGEIVHTKKYEERNNGVITEGAVSADSKGVVYVDVEITNKGALYGQAKNLQNLKRSDLEAYYKQTWNLPGMMLEYIDLKDKPAQEILQESVQFSVPSYLKKMGNLYMLKPFLLDLEEDYKVNSKIEKNNDFYLSFSRNNTHSYTLKIPEEMLFEEIPESVQVEREFGTYSIQYEKISSNELKFSRSFTLKKGLYSKAEYYQFVDFIKIMKKNDNKYLLLKKH